MTEYYPDNWIIMRIHKHYRVLAGWSGGYTQGDSWRMNSGIVMCEDDGDYYSFYGWSGSVYKCHKESYGLRMNNYHIWAGYKKALGDKAKFMDEETDWLKVDWIT